MSLKTRPSPSHNLFPSISRMVTQPLVTEEASEHGNMEDFVSDDNNTEMRKFPNFRQASNRVIYI